MKSMVVWIVAAVVLTVGPAGVRAEIAGEEGSDLWIESKIMTTYTLNEHLSPFELDVAVEGGVVRLTGEVESDLHRELAEQIALGVKGARRVENEIRVGDEPARSKEESEFLRTVKDATLTARVKSNLLWNRNTDGLDIDVDTDDGVVTLTGVVASDLKRQLVLQIAKNTNGVRKVEDRLRVSAEEKQRIEENSPVAKTQRVVSDTWITAKVKTMLMFNKNADGADIEVSTQEGVVTLKGTVLSPEQRDRIVETVQDVVNVKGVRDRLRVAM